MLMVGDTRLLQCKKYCCLLVPIAIVVPTLPEGWGTISLGGDGFKGEECQFVYWDGIGRWEKGRRGGGGIITASNIIGNEIPSYHPSYHLGIAIVRKSALEIFPSSPKV